MAQLSVDTALALTTAGVAIASLLTGLEAYVGRRELARGGLLDTAVLSRGRELFPGLPPPTGWMTWLSFGYVGCSIAALAGLAGGVPALGAIAVLGIALCAVLQAGAMPYGRDGADEMAIIITVPMAVVALAGAPEPLGEISLFFIASQLGLSYLAAGIAKTRGPFWRDGSALLRIAVTETYGSPRLARLFRDRPILGKTATWSATGWELGMPAVLIVGGPPARVGLVLGIGFHLANAYFMGLNRFLLWFLAAYPAAFFVSQRYGLLS